MASGSQNMTTYLAKQIIGSNAAANPAGALLQSGTNRADDSATGDTWLFLNTVNSTTNPWGIFHSQVDNKIKIIGDGTDDFWVDMDTGDTYIGGSLDTGSILTVRAQDSAHEGGEIVLSPATDSFSTVHIDAYDSMFRLHDGTNERFKVNISSGDTTINGNLGIGADYAVLGGSYKLYVNGTTCLNDNLIFQVSNGGGIYYKGTKNTYRMIRFIDNTADVNGNGISIGGGGLAIFGSGESADTMVSNLGYTGGSEVTVISSDGSILFYPGQNSYDAAAKIEMTAGRIWAGVNGNTTRENQVGCQSGAGQLFLWSAAATDGDRGLYLPAHGSGGAFAIIRANTNNSITILGNDIWGEYVRVNSNWVGFYNARQGGTRYGYIQCNVDRMYFRKENSTANLTYYFDFGSTVQAPTFRAGNDNATYSVDRCKVYAANGVVGIHSATNRGLYEFTDGKWIVYLQHSDDTVRFGYNAYVYQATRASYLLDRTNSTATYLNYGAAGLAASAITWLTCWNGYELRAISKAEMANAVDSSHKWVRLGGDTMTGLLKITTNSTTLTIGAQNSSCCHIYVDQNVPFAFNRGFLMVNSGDIGTSTYPAGNIVVKAGGRVSGNGGALYLGNSNNANWVLIADCCAQAGNAYWKIYSGSGEATFKKVYNAVWNDYAECREVETEEPGYCVTETKSGKMIKTTKRLQAGCKIISDTFGTCMGETETAKTPIAVAGRVLVYPYRAREKYTLGAAVCSAPDGTVDIMSRDEIMMYPERIVGTVSEIPTYDIWNGGISKDPDPISVNGRIWIYVK